MGKFRVTGNFLISFGLYYGIVMLLYGGKNVAGSSKPSRLQGAVDVLADSREHVPMSTFGADDVSVPGGGGSGRKSVWGN